jgi:hypothetical protein
MLRELPGARVESCEVTDSRMYLKVVTSRVQFELARRRRARRRGHQQLRDRPGLAR